jgi:dGTPase
LSDPRIARFSEQTGDPTPGAKPAEFRSVWEQDSDRLLYSGAFRRLAVITQVVSPAGGHAFHNRLTHALKVAQVGRRIAEKLLREGADKELIRSLGGLEPPVVEAASFAHDLGHPPFGHIAEEELDALLRDNGNDDGYEGNAQSFRIITRLETRESRGGGLDLTRATLNATLKYPRLRPPEVTDRKVKFGAYKTESEEFKFAREGSAEGVCSLEAQIMDWADDITYAVHDLEDFYRVGRIPLERLGKAPDELQAFLAGMFQREKILEGDRSPYEDTASSLFMFCPVSERYTGTRTQRSALRGWASSIIHEAVSETKVTEKGLIRPERANRVVSILKQLTWHYVIEGSSVATEQYGRRVMVQTLFDILNQAANAEAKWRLFPFAFQEQLREGLATPARTTADYIASLGEQRAVELFSELSGAPLKPVVTGLPL